jgi:glycosyltransferase involved in cell wall biosynthesis
VSSELVEWQHVPLSGKVDSFLAHHFPVFFSYVRLRPEYGFDVLLDAMARYAVEYPDSGFIWVGPSAREVNEIKRIIDSSRVSPNNVMLLPNLGHDDFMTIMERCFAVIRAHSCDGVSASVLEALSLKLPVIACKDGRRPPGVITYDKDSSVDLLDKLQCVTTNYATITTRLPVPKLERNTDAMVDLLLRA